MTATLSVLFVACWSSGFIGAKLGAGSAEVPTLLMWRFLPLAVVLPPIVWLSARRRNTMPAPRALGRQVVIGMLSQSGYLLSVYWAVDLGVNTGTTALIDGIQPLVAAALLGPVLGVAVPRMQWVGLAIGMGGVVMVTAADAGAGTSAPWWAYAIPFLGMLSLVASTFVQPLQALVIHCSTSAIVFTTLAIVSDAAVPPSVSTFWIALLWLIVLSTFGGYGLYWLLLLRIGITSVNTLMFLIAPVTAVWGALMFGESFTPFTALGLAVGIVAVVVVTRVGNRPKKQDEGTDSCPPRASITSR